MLEYYEIQEYGLIPARAGSTSRISRPSTASRAHPRSRGEHSVLSCRRVRLPGSSPLARGALHRQNGLGHFRGLIPARAGSTRSRPLTFSRPKAHPRSRGEHLRRYTAKRFLHGLIPARAGSTRCGSGGPERRGAHPRSRGEHRRMRELIFMGAGSSPLARGAPLVGVSPGSYFGLIPARAGSTSLSSKRSPLRRAHPRSRGEHRKTAAKAIAWTGSSPLARGALIYIDAHTGRGGLIPARAGSTWFPGLV